MWYVIDSQTTKGKYTQGDTIKLETETIKSNLCVYSDAFNKFMIFCVYILYDTHKIL